MVQTFKHLDTIDARGEGALQVYLRQAVMNRIRDHIRRVARRPAATALDSQHEDEGPSPLEQAWARSRRTLRGGARPVERCRSRADRRERRAGVQLRATRRSHRTRVAGRGA